MRPIERQRDQYALLSPFLRQAAWELKPHQRAQIDPHAPDLTQLADIPEHGGRWDFPHEDVKEPSGYQSARYHTWGVHPTDAPAVHEWDKFGKPQKIYYNPELTDITTEHDPDLGDRSYPTNRGNKIEDLQEKAPGTVWRGLSHEEMEAAKKNGYFQSNGSYNFEGQEGSTLFDERPGTAGSYANGYAPYQHKPTFSRPSHVIGIPDQNYPRNSVGEVEVPDQIPLDSVTHHYRGDVVSIDPGSYGGYQAAPNPDYGYNGFDDQPSRSSSPSSTVQWSPGELHRG